MQPIRFLVTTDAQGGIHIPATGLPPGTRVEVIVTLASEGTRDGAPVWERLAAMGRTIPESDLAKLPTDLARNFDHYTYGVPKEE